MVITLLYSTIINHRSLSSVSPPLIVHPRIQQFFMKLQKYDFDLEYFPGKTMVVSDLIRCVQFTFDSLPINDVRLIEFQKETLYRNNSRNTFWKDDHNNGTFLKQQNFTIQHPGRNCLQQWFTAERSTYHYPISTTQHYGNNLTPGPHCIERCKNRAQQSVYWPFKLNISLTNRAPLWSI